MLRTLASRQGNSVIEPAKKKFSRLNLQRVAHRNSAAGQFKHFSFYKTLFWFATVDRLPPAAMLRLAESGDKTLAIRKTAARIRGVRARMAIIGLAREGFRANLFNLPSLKPELGVEESPANYSPEGWTQQDASGARPRLNAALCSDICCLPAIPQGLG
jgi:hypothetical protein